MKAKCVGPECTKAAQAKNLCSRHYEQQRRGVGLTVDPSKVHTPCSVAGCEIDVRCKGLCNFHYRRKLAGRDLAAPRSGTVRPCSVTDCHDTVKSLGYCTFHYMRSRHGIPLEAPRRKSARPGYEWRLDDQGYVFRHVVDQDGRRIRQSEHRVVMEEYLGRNLLPHENVHHRNGDREDNSISNLELWSRSQPPGQRVVDKIEWMLEFLAEEGFDTSHLETQKESLLKQYRNEG